MRMKKMAKKIVLERRRDMTEYSGKVETVTEYDDELRKDIENVIKSGREADMHELKSLREENSRAISDAWLRGDDKARQSLEIESARLQREWDNLMPLSAILIAKIKEEYAVISAKRRIFKK
jgi:hypothetical protein